MLGWREEIKEKSGDNLLIAFSFSASQHLSLSINHFLLSGVRFSSDFQVRNVILPCRKDS
jgi:hypothetical protein